MTQSVNGNMIYTFEPGKGISPFYFGESIEPLLSMYSPVYIATEGDESWDEYDFFDGSIEVYADKELKTIESIACRENCYWEGVNLIDLPIQEFISRFESKQDRYHIERIELVEEDQDVYDFDDLGLQLWVNDANKIVTVFVSDILP